MTEQRITCEAEEEINQLEEQVVSMRVIFNQPVRKLLKPVDTNFTSTAETESDRIQDLNVVYLTLIKVQSNQNLKLNSETISAGYSRILHQNTVRRSLR